MDVLTIQVPRLDAQQQRRDQSVAIKQAAAARSSTIIVLTLTHWPPSHLTPNWLSALAEFADAVGVASGRPPILAEVPPDTFDDLMVGRQPRVLAATEFVLDQVFRDCGRAKPRRLAAVKDVLRIRSGEIISARVDALKLVQYGHFELPGASHHTNAQINFGSLLSGLDGTNGLRGYITSVAAREIAHAKPATLVYPTDFNDRVLPRMVRDIRSNLLRIGIPTVDVRITGTYAEPRLADEELARVRSGGAVALVTDIAGKGGRLDNAWNELVQLGVTPVLGVVFLSRGALTGMAGGDAVRSLAQINAAVIPREDCTLPGREVPIRAAVVHAPQTQKLEPWQAPRAEYWSSVLLDGQIGAPPEHDPRHLHDLFVRPSLDPDHLDALMSQINVKLVDLGVKLVVYHDTPAAEAMANRLKALLGVATQAITRSVNNVWSLPSAFRGHGEPVAIFDDGRNRGDAQIDMTYEVERRGFRVVAAVILEDKLDDRGAFTIRAIENRSDPPIRTFSVHRGIAAIRATSETCLLHEVDRAVDVIMRSASRRPGFAAAAYRALTTHRLWPPEGVPSSRADTNGLLELDDTCGVSEQWNQLLLHHRALSAQPRAMDTIVRDALLELRTEGLVDRLVELDPLWRERAVLWLAPDDLRLLTTDRIRSLGCRLSFGLGALAAAETVHHFAEIFDLVVKELEAQPEAGERRYMDLVLHVLRATQSRQDPVEWLEVAADALAAGSTPAVREFREDLLVLVAALSVGGRRRPNVLAVPSPAGEPSVNPSEEEIESYGRRGWVLDVRPREASFTDGGAPSDVDRRDALAVGIAIAQRRPARTRDVTAYFMDAKEFASRRKAQHHLDTTRAHLRSGDLRAIALVDPDGSKGEEKAIAVTDRPGTLICYDEGEPLMRELAKRLRRT